MDEITDRPTPLPPVKALILPAALLEQMGQEAARLAPEEACGLLGGSLAAGIYRARQAWPVENMLHSPTRYQLDPRQQLAAFEAIEAAGLELVAIYHSHPRGPDRPSPTDLAEAYYPQAAYLIWSGRTGIWKCRAFTLREHTAQALAIRVE